MPWRDVVQLAFESLSANKLRTILTMLGMIIGVGAVVLLVSIGTGAKNYINREFEGIGTNLVMVQPGKTDVKMGLGPPIGSTKRKLTLGDVDAVQRQSQNLEAVMGVMLGAGTVKTELRSNNVTILGANDKFPRIIHIKIQSGQFFTHEEDEFGRRVVVLGYNVAHNLFPNEDALGKLVKIAESEHRVVGVAAKAGNKLGFNLDDLIIIPNRSAMRIFNDDKLFGIRAKARSKIGMADAVAELTGILKQRHEGQVDFTVVTEDNMMDTMNTIMNMLTYMLAGIAAISTMVGGIGIMNIMLVSVTERTREIGIRRAVGARRQDILKQFLTEALVLSLIGGMIGLFGSVAMTYLISWFTPSFDMRAPMLQVALPAFLVSSLAGIVFGVWPARKAAYIETIDALRFE